MYDPDLTSRQIERVERALGRKLRRLPVHLVDEWVAHLADKEGTSLTPEESEFIENELILARLDFQYWAERYCWIIDDERNLQRLTLWHSQKVLLKFIARLEVEMRDRHAKGEKVDGIRVILHKARQLGATMVSQALNVHRCNFNANVTSLIASAAPDKTAMIFERAQRIYTNMPWWMRGKLKQKTQEFGMAWADLDSRIVLQDGSQKSGVGQGETWEFVHLTECASWENPRTITHDLFPAIARSPKTLAILESTAQGMGNWWHEFTEQARAGDTTWTYVFIPWYIEPKRWRRTPPPLWAPSSTTELHAKKVEETSSLFTLDGSSVILDREQLYWYETMRSQYYKEGALAEFLTNYCATPEESFQHSTQGAFDTETIDALALRTTAPKMFELV